MNHIRNYDQFLNEEYSFNRLKNDVKLTTEYSIVYVLINAIIYIANIFALFKGKRFREEFSRMISPTRTNLNKIYKIGMFFNKQDLENVLKMDKENLINYVNDLQKKYEDKFSSSLIEDIKELLKRSKNPEIIKMYNKIIEVIGNDDVKKDMREVDPYGEDDWGDGSKSLDVRHFMISYNNDDFINYYHNIFLNRMRDLEVEFDEDDGNRFHYSDAAFFTDEIRKILLNKTITFLPTSNDKIILKLRKKIKVKDVYFGYDKQEYTFRLWFKDTNGNTYESSMKSENKIKILD